MSRLKADFSELNYKLAEQNNRSEARMEEISYRLDRVLGVVQQHQKGAVKKPAAKGTAKEHEQRNSEMEALYNTSRSDYLKGEYAVAYNGFKQIYETLNTGEMAENALYWMGMCMLDANKRENAETLFKSLLDKYPQSPKVCAVIFKLSSMAEDAGKKAEQKAYLGKLLGTEHCVASNEFQRAADILPAL
jgi:TolA-binding protein